MEKNTLEGKVAAELHEIASDLGIEGHKGLKKADLIDRILTHANGAAKTLAPAETTTEPQRPDRPGSGEDSRPRSSNERSGNERSGNGGVRQDERPSDRPQQERFERQERSGGGPARDQGPGRDGARRRPSREERRRAREERRVREIEMREEEIQTAPT